MVRTLRTAALCCGVSILWGGARGFAENGSQPGELRAYATIHSIGFEWDLAGDRDHDAVCEVQYRAEGEKEWHPALPLFRVDYQWWWAELKPDPRFNLFAGSILFLHSDTLYEVRLSLSDPDGGQAEKRLQVKTRPLPVIPRGGRIYHVSPGQGKGDGSAGKPFQAVPEAQEAAGPGDTILLHRGNYGGLEITRSGEPGKHRVFRAAGDGEAVFDWADVRADHIWLEGLTLRRSERSNGLRAIGAAKDVVVSRCRFDGFHYSIFLNATCQGWTIMDNDITGDNAPDLKGRAAFSGEGVELQHSSHHVVAYNRISHVADGVSYPHTNCDIYGNDVFDVSDDGLEPDYGYANNRMWGNRIYNYQNNALSFQPMCKGPWYFIRNQVVGGGFIFKFRVQDRFLLANNTFVRQNGFGGRMHHILTSLSRNNLYISAGGSAPVWTAYDCTQPQYCLPNVYQPFWKTDVDYDGFDWGAAVPGKAFRWNNVDFYPDLKSFAKAVGIEEHGIHVRKEEIFADYSLPEEGAPIAAPMLSLKPGCNAVDAGDILPNINDRFIGKAPDLGALEYGMPLPHYGPRSDDATRMRCEARWEN